MARKPIALVGKYLQNSGGPTGNGNYACFTVDGLGSSLYIPLNRDANGGPIGDQAGQTFTITLPPVSTDDMVVTVGKGDKRRTVALDPAAFGNDPVADATTAVATAAAAGNVESLIEAINGLVDAKLAAAA